MTTVNSSESLDRQELSLRGHLKRLAKEIEKAKRLLRDPHALVMERDNYARRLALHIEQREYEAARERRRRARGERD